MAVRQPRGVRLSVDELRQTRLRVTYDGPFTFEAAEDDLGYGRTALSQVFYAAHGVLTELRLIQEKVQ